MRSHLYSRKPRNKQSFPEVNLTPLIDTAWTILIIFMVTASVPRPENALQIELPHGNVKEISDTLQEELVVLVSKTGDISFNGKAIKEEELIAALKKVVNKNAQKTVFVKADKTAPWGNVAELVDKIKDCGGVRYVALATASNSR